MHALSLTIFVGHLCTHSHNPSIQTKCSGAAVLYGGIDKQKQKVAPSVWSDNTLVISSLWYQFLALSFVYPSFLHACSCRWISLRSYPCDHQLARHQVLPETKRCPGGTAQHTAAIHYYAYLWLCGSQCIHGRSMSLLFLCVSIIKVLCDVISCGPECNVAMVASHSSHSLVTVDSQSLLSFIFQALKH